MVIAMMDSIRANPVPANMIECINAFPPEIGIRFYEPADLEGQFIYTTSGIAVIGEHPYPDIGQLIVFDSSNTSGFILNPEADSISITSEIFIFPEYYGYLGYTPAPIKGHYIRISWENYGRWSYDFTTTDHGETEVVINEISANCDWGPEANFIELYNQNDSALDIGGWMVICDTICTIPENTVIEGNGFYVFDQCDFPDIFDMDAGADNIYLINSDCVLVDQVGWSSDHGPNVSFMRFPDGDVHQYGGYIGFNDQSSNTFENGFPSRGAPNRHNSPGFVVIGAHGCNESGNSDLHWTDPVWDPNFAYSLAVRNFDHYPQDLNDGELVYQGIDQNVLDMVPPGNPLAFYTIFARNAGGGYSIPTDESRAMVILQTAGIDKNPELPKNISSLECYPNPFNASVTISFELNQSGIVAISIYNLRGQKVCTVSDGFLSVGEHRITWKGSDYPSGVYFARLEAGGSSKSIKMVLLK